MNDKFNHNYYDARGNAAQFILIFIILLACGAIAYVFISPWSYVVPTGPIIFHKQLSPVEDTAANGATKTKTDTTSKDKEGK